MKAPPITAPILKFIVLAISILSSAAHSQFAWKLDSSGIKANLKQALFAQNQFVTVGDSDSVAFRRGLLAILHQRATHRSSRTPGKG
jgi:hypothetical protein